MTYPSWTEKDGKRFQKHRVNLHLRLDEVMESLGFHSLTDVIEIERGTRKPPSNWEDKMIAFAEKKNSTRL